MSGTHRRSLVSLVQTYRWGRGAELGVDKGLLYSMLLESCPSLMSLTGVDIFPIPPRRDQVFAIQRHHHTRASLLVMRTDEAAPLVPDGALDFCFIDADHSEPAVTSDIAHWQAKVKPGGWFGGHDYNPQKFPGVVTAVKRAFGSRVEFWPGTVWGVWV